MQVPRPEDIDPNAPANPVWKELSVKPGQLVRLRFDLSDSFKAGDIVSLSSDLRVDTSSPTKRPGQSDDNVNKDSIASVRIFKWVEKQTVVSIHSVGGRNGGIKHAHLVGKMTNKVSMGPYAPGDVVRVKTDNVNTDYKTTVYPPYPDRNGRMYPIPDNMVGIVAKCETPTGKELSNAVRAGAAGSSRSTATATYIVEFSILDVERVYVPYIHYVPVLGLQPLTPAETAAEMTRLLRTKGLKRTLGHWKEPGITINYNVYP